MKTHSKVLFPNAIFKKFYKLTHEEHGQVTVCQMYQEIPAESQTGFRSLFHFDWFDPGVSEWNRGGGKTVEWMDLCLLSWLSLKD